jgi:hypothetical protein
MVGANTLDTMHFKLNDLSGSKLSNKNIRVNRLDFAFAAEIVHLTTLGVKCDVACVNVSVMVTKAGVFFSRCCIFIDAAFNVEIQNDGVEVAGLAARGVFLGGLLEPLHPVETFYRTFERDETETRGEDFVLNDGCIVEDVDEFNGESGHFGDQDTAKSVCDGGIEADEGEGGIVCLVLVEVDPEVLFGSV